MHHYTSRTVVGCLAVVGIVAALWVIPSYAGAQQMPGTLAQPAMSSARVWINNKTRDEAIPVTLIAGDPKAAMPVVVQGVTSVSVNGLVEARTAATKQSWEYRSVSAAADQELSAVLNGLGNEGWEAVGVTSQPGAKMTVLLKRPR
jgi:hypothetical protein